jgi:hypothetical protein
LIRVLRPHLSLQQLTKSLHLLHQFLILFFELAVLLNQFIDRLQGVRGAGLSLGSLGVKDSAHGWRREQKKAHSQGVSLHYSLR